jgi:hypothetical protein
MNVLKEKLEKEKHSAPNPPKKYLGRKPNQGG